MADAPAAVTSAVDPTVFRTVMGHYPTGVAVVTAVDGEGPVGMVVGSFSSVSLDPPLVSFMPMRTSSTYERLWGCDAYCINVLAYDQLDVCATMAQGGPEKFDRVPWRLSEHGTPALCDVVAHVQCRPDTVVEAGDHLIVLCRVEAMEVVRPTAPLLFWQGGYGLFKTLDPGRDAARGDARTLAVLRALEHGWG